MRVGIKPAGACDLTTGQTALVAPISARSGDSVEGPSGVPPGWPPALKGPPPLRTEIPLAPRLTPDFERFVARRFPNQDFARLDVPNGSFGGRVHPGEVVRHQPVIFFHGNGDSALGSEGGPRLKGWRESVRTFLGEGYRACELYGTTWGPASVDAYLEQSHDRDNLMQVRRFIEAVLEYTGADQVDIIAHSMGVTLARKAIKGGTFTDPRTGEEFDLGPPISARVDTFVGIAGANVGLEGAFYQPQHPVTSPHGGFYPGVLTPIGVLGMADILRDVNSERAYEGDHRFSVWTRDDDFAGMVWGRQTSRIPGQSGEAVYRDYDHFEVKDRTTRLQYEMVTGHTVRP